MSGFFLLQEELYLIGYTALMNRSLSQNHFTRGI